MKENLLEKIRNAGVVGAGGAGFPSHVKLLSQAEYLIINGAECEPLLRVDQQLMGLYTEKLINCVDNLTHVFNFKKAYICLKKKHRSVIDKLNGIKKADCIEIFLLDDFYPAGDEQTLVFEVTKRIVPEGSIPLKVGCIVLNVETVLNIYDSLDSIPVTETYLTITGEVPTPVTLRIPIGTKIRDALKIAGLESTEGKVVIDGGPMMGKIIKNFETPITKTSKGLIVLDEFHSLVKAKTLDIEVITKLAKTACVQCSQCSALCPRHLLGHDLNPHKIMRALKYSFDNSDNYSPTLICCECNVCELYACPMGLSPRTINSALKNKLISSGIRYTGRDKVYNASEAREFRKVPVKSLIRRLNLKKYDIDAPYVETIYIPHQVVIPLKQHAGAPAVPVVKKGQRVEKGELIADIQKDALGAKIHASISGKINEVSGFVIIESEARS